jgi:hypothetical protein
VTGAGLTAGMALEQAELELVYAANQKQSWC